MKRSVLILSLAAFVLSSNAQVLKSNLLNGYKQGDKLEKATYNKADAVSYTHLTLPTIA